MAQKQINPPTKLIVIGGSSGSLPAIINILGQLKLDFSIPILIIPHRAKNPDGSLEEMLSTKTHLKVCALEEKDPIKRGCLYLAPPDYHLLIEKDKSFSLDDSEKVQFSRPSIDVTFQSAAEVYGPNLIAVILSGANADGANGASAVIKAGGYVLIQDPTEAIVSYMPQYALNQIKSSLVYTTIAIAHFLNTLSNL